MADDPDRDAVPLGAAGHRHGGVLPDDTSLCPEELAVISRILARQLGVRHQQLASIQPAAAPPTALGTAVSSGRSERGGVLTVDAALAARTLREIDELSDALRRLGERDYGVCSECRMPISYQRLLVLPEVKRCGNCEAFREQRSRYPPGP